MIGMLLTNPGRLATPQLSGRAPLGPARSKRMMKWRACCAPATPHDGPLQLLVIRLLQHGGTVLWLDAPLR